MNQFIVNAIFAECSLYIICERFRVEPEFVMDVWRAWREEQAW